MGHTGMMAVILAGGKGARLRPLTVSIPKPLLPLDNVPIIDVVLRQLSRAGIDRIAITLGYLPHLFQACIGTGDRHDVNIEYYYEEQPLGTAGSLRLIDDPAETLLVMNGDLLTTIDYGALVNHHRAVGAHATIAVHRRTSFVDYGVIEQTAEGELARYIEKPRIPYLVSMGVNVLSRRALEHIPADRSFDMPDLMSTLKDAGRRVACFEPDCYWQDIGRMEDYERASADFAADPTRFLAVRYSPV